MRDRTSSLEDFRSTFYKGALALFSFRTPCDYFFFHINSQSRNELPPSFQIVQIFMKHAFASLKACWWPGQWLSRNWNTQHNMVSTIHVLTSRIMLLNRCKGDREKSMGHSSRTHQAFISRQVKACWNWKEQMVATALPRCSSQISRFFVTPLDYNIISHQNYPPIVPRSFGLSWIITVLPIIPSSRIKMADIDISQIRFAQLDSAREMRCGCYSNWQHNYFHCNVPAPGGHSAPC